MGEIKAGTRIFTLFLQKAPGLCRSLLASVSLPQQFPHIYHPPSLLIFRQPQIHCPFSQSELYIPIRHIGIFLQKQRNRPATSGVDILVPDLAEYSFSSFLQLMMAEPGATTSGLQTQDEVGPRPE